MRRENLFKANFMSSHAQKTLLNKKLSQRSSSFASPLLNRPPNWTIVKRVPATSSSLFSLFISYCHPLLPLAKTSFYFRLSFQFDQHHNQLRSPQLDCALLNILEWVLFFIKKHFLLKKDCCYLPSFLHCYRLY